MCKSLKTRPRNTIRVYRHFLSCYKCNQSDTNHKINPCFYGTGWKPALHSPLPQNLPFGFAEPGAVIANECFLSVNLSLAPKYLYGWGGLGAAGKAAPMRRGPRQPALHGVLRRGDGHAARLRPNYLAREAGRAARMASYLASASFPGSPACTATAMTSAGVGSIRSWMDVVRKPLMPSLGSRS